MQRFPAPALQLGLQIHAPETSLQAVPHRNWRIREAEWSGMKATGAPGKSQADESEAGCGHGPMWQFAKLRH